jgi:hypothetical protein
MYQQTKFQKEKRFNTLKNHAQQNVVSLITLFNVVCSLTDTINGMFNFYILKIIGKNKILRAYLVGLFVKAK